ncbi:NADPH-dependent 7-cyano-7-deazaguanine reductase QueF [Carboxylicivirga linearis]|uniref:NADPH-dependent 7-cyano-7-deazaguanine reductase QueF n=1 Tax=Carboxylicivirga linearis TaxID=1628157 RepID=A0ABS5JUP6_9BACT|nr:NADPH-dependent 7-cyano-7-deazaguanine reductase QueF [Carboxylicivirga linearis]MBS2098639.1 NADPH-dependent 7-cyano-7-deazaguanine reductase QueF [Carboxylicivirga linearis]
MHEAKFLGKQVTYPQQYAPEMLVAVPRQLNREQYELVENNLPFVGLDVWHAYELSFLTKKGLPVTGLLKLVYPSDNEFLVESKSLKLYLNSFNMERYGNTPLEGIKMVMDTIKKDLDNCLQTNVTVSFFNNLNSHSPFDFADFNLLEDDSEAVDLNFTAFNEDPELLQPSSGTELKAATHLLRSNCKITNQPDWGSAYIYIKGESTPEKMSLLQYLVSIRNENHFHEEICEMIYTRLWNLFKPEELMVACIYTRRGGIDICPVRASDNSLLKLNLTDSNVLSLKLLRQ